MFSFNSYWTCLYVLRKNCRILTSLLWGEQQRQCKANLSKIGTLGKGRVKNEWAVGSTMLWDHCLFARDQEKTTDELYVNLCDRLSPGDSPDVFASFVFFSEHGKLTDNVKHRLKVHYQKWKFLVETYKVSFNSSAVKPLNKE